MRFGNATFYSVISEEREEDQDNYLVEKKNCKGKIKLEPTKLTGSVTDTAITWSRPFHQNQMHLQYLPSIWAIRTHYIRKKQE